MEHSDVASASLQSCFDTGLVYRADELPVWSEPEYIAEFISDCPEVVSDLLRLFLCDAATTLDLLKEQALDGDGRAIMRSLHTLKGSCCQIGAQRLGTLVQDIEYRFASGHFLDVAQRLSSVEEAFDSLRTELLGKIDSIEKGMRDYGQEEKRAPSTHAEINVGRL